MRRFLAILIFLLPLAAVAATAPPAIMAAVRALDPAGHVDQITPGPVPGLTTVSIGRRLLVVSNSGRYVFDGQVFDLKTGTDLTVEHKNAWRLRLLSSIPVTTRITFAPAHPAFTVAVFTDVDCAYCRVLASHLGGYLADGIALQFIASPLSSRGTPTYTAAENVWCAVHPHKAFIKAYSGGVPAPTPRPCAVIVAHDSQVAHAMGLPGTPGLIGPHGAV
ncbi:thiol-disulfide interchange protein DsbC, partial [mine drainage metagenome]